MRKFYLEKKTNKNTPASCCQDNGLILTSIKSRFLIKSNRNF
jgi:hypothetical protein